jgi:hypothetical protein
LATIPLDTDGERFTFATTLSVVLDVSPREPVDDDVVVPAPFTRTLTMEIIGVVDLESGTIGITQVGEGAGAGVVIFRR